MAKRRTKTVGPQYKLDSWTTAVLQYWRSSLIEASQVEALAQSNETMLEIPSSSLSSAKVNPSVFRAILSKLPKRSASPERNFISVVLCPLRLLPESSGRRNTKPFNVFLVPCRVYDDGRLAAPPQALPWIPREYLEPAVDDQSPSIGTIARVEAFFDKEAPRSFDSFQEYISYAETFFKYVSGTSVQRYSNEAFTRIDGIVVMPFSDKLGPISSMLRCIDDVLRGQRHPGMLTSLCPMKQLNRKLYERSPYSVYARSRQHVAHGSSSFPLAKSQREAVHRFLQTPEGEVFCVNGPPGTGKTTVLKSFITTLWTQAALEQRNSPPVMLVCGATNQSVTNVIDAFEADADEQSLAERWIPGLHSFGTFCASFTKAEVSQHYQLELSNGEGFSASLERRDALHEAREFFLTKCSDELEVVRSIPKAIKLLTALMAQEQRLFRRALKERLGLNPLQLQLSRFTPLGDEERQRLFEILEPLDTRFRVRMLWLAGHYWEARWLLSCAEELDHRERIDDSAPRFRNARSDWQRRAMLTPAFVSTLSMSCRFFASRDSRVSPPLDVLFFDEAGQITPENAAATAILANKLVVIGDTAQLQPYSVIAPHIDEAHLRAQKLLKGHNPAGFRKLAKAGLSSSSSNLMQLAIRACRFEDGQIVGASLEEHRRSVPEIVAFCNRLSYFGRLKPLRPALKRRILPSFGFCDMAGTQSYSVGVSRRNPREAEYIVAFVTRMAESIKDFYGKPLDEVLAILTPFTAQAQYLKNLLRAKYPQLVIGTVHSLQGAERSIVVFSSCYDASFTGTPVFDADSRMLNVAVSRAKDSFLVFGSKEIFLRTSEQLSPSTLLGTFLFSDAQNILAREDAAALDESSLASGKRLANLDEHRLALKTAFRRAREQVLIASPTISIRAIEADGLTDDIRQATSRGVRVIVFTDSLLDSPEGIAKPQAEEGRRALSEAGAEVFVTDRIHNKSLAVDSDILIEGSFNWLSAVRTAGSRHQKHETSHMIQGAEAAELIEALSGELFSRAQRVLERQSGS